MNIDMSVRLFTMHVCIHSIASIETKLHPCGKASCNIPKWNNVLAAYMLKWGVSLVLFASNFNACCIWKVINTWWLDMSSAFLFFVQLKHSIHFVFFCLVWKEHISLTLAMKAGIYFVAWVPLKTTKYKKKITTSTQNMHWPRTMWCCESVRVEPCCWAAFLMYLLFSWHFHLLCVVRQLQQHSSDSLGVHCCRQLSAQIKWILELCGRKSLHWLDFRSLYSNLLISYFDNSTIVERKLINTILNWKSLMFPMESSSLTAGMFFTN